MHISFNHICGLLTTTTGKKNLPKPFKVATNLLVKSLVFSNKNIKLI